MNNSNLSIDNMVEFAMGLSMTTLFARAMNNTFDNTQRMMNNNQLNTSAKYIYAMVGGKQCGPYSLGEVMELIKTQQIGPKTYIWKAGMPDWMQAENITDISPHLSMVPPTFNEQ